MVATPFDGASPLLNLVIKWEEKFNGTIYRNCNGSFYESKKYG